MTRVKERLPKGVSRRGDSYRWSVMVDGVRRSGTGSTIADAVTARSAAMGAIKDGVPVAAVIKGWTILEAADYCINLPAPGGWRGSKGAKQARINIDAAVQFFKGDCLCSSLTLDKLEDYTAHLAKRGNSNATINRKMSALRKVMKLAVRKGQLKALPLFPGMMKESVGRRCDMSQDDEKALLNLLDRMGCHEHHEAITVLIDTGMRPSELWALTRSDVNVKSNILLIHGKNGAGTKNGEFRSVPMSLRVRTIIRDKVAYGGASGDLLFPYSNGWMRRTWNRARSILEKDDDPTWIPYICRHTCASRLVRRGTPLPAVQQWLGHKTIEMTMRYAYLMPKQLLDYVHLLDDLNEETFAA